MSKEQTKCDGCMRRFGEMDDEPVECEECGILSCPECYGMHECEEGEEKQEVK